LAPRSPIEVEITVAGNARRITLPRCAPGNTGAAVEHLAHHRQYRAIDSDVAQRVASVLQAIENARST
jgi:hypothetical protein